MRNSDDLWDAARKGRRMESGTGVPHSKTLTRMPKQRAAYAEDGLRLA